MDHIREEIDPQRRNITFLKETRARAERGEPSLNAIHVIMGDDMGERIKNMSRCAMEKRVVEHFVLAEKP